MKKALAFLSILLISVAAFGQSRGTLYVVPDATTPFDIGLKAPTLVLQEDTSTLHQVTVFADSTKTLTTATSSPVGGLQNVVEDLTPQLGGDLDVNGFEITDPDDGADITHKAGSGTVAGTHIFEGSVTSANTITIDPELRTLSASGTLTITGAASNLFKGGGNVFYTSVTPDTDNSRWFGLNNKQWGRIYAHDLYLTGFITHSVSGGDLTYIAGTGAGAGDHIFQSPLASGFDLTLTLPTATGQPMTFANNDSGTSLTRFDTDVFDVTGSMTVGGTVDGVDVATTTTSSSVIPDNEILRADGGARGVQGSGWLISDVGNQSVTADYAGLLGQFIKNTNSDAVSVAGAVLQVENDLGYYGLIGMTSSASTIGSGAFVNTFHHYNQGYGDSLYTVDGNKSHVWYSDPTDSHDFSALSNQVMELDADGDLAVSGRVTEAGTFANIHVHDAGASAQSIVTGASYVKVTGFANNGESSNCTADVANNKITITKTGYYMVSHNSSFTGDTNNVTYFVAAFLDGTEVDALHFVRKLGVAGDVGSASFSGILDVTSAPLDLDIRVRHDNGGSIEYTMEYANLTVTYLGET